ncbi:ABC-2 transporter permease [Allorhodopirellula solitaria]|uniref:ABC-2 family transporter protein n=1 Tax=Allorhodopirellula solitaria TaxID=2527987 RepID=A0A5C5XRC5_9BACT|nr:hypothetical protein [Allorhodopirellula solitaria]TWT64615.1 hypothetical protein CA85_37480 [Allorhodopirellula solitaria]
MNVALRHLLWKDTRMIASLATAILVGTLVFQLMIWFTIWANASPSNIYYTIALWILMPNLMALGVPPMLVGSEEESGTLGWLRSLPVPWPLVVVSKSLVGVIAVGVSWVFSSLLLWMTISVWESVLPLTVESMLQSDAIRGFAFFSLELLFTGFFLAYLCRSPLRGLIILVPTIVGLFYAMQWVEAWWDSHEDPHHLWSIGRVLITIAYTAFLILMPLLPARRRLARRRSRKSAGPPPGLAERDDQPYAPSAMLGEASRPAMWRAFLWQAWRQQSRPLIGLAIVAVLLMTAFWLRTFLFGLTRPWVSSDNMPLIVSVVLVLVCTWMGCLCFYPDSISRRHFFLADRGFPKRHVWWSRIVAPALAMVLVLLLVHYLGAGFRTRPWQTITRSCCLLGFACGLLSSMWMSRSTLAFFVAPLLTLAILFASMPFLDHYSGYLSYVALAAIPLVVASWRMTGDWLKDAYRWTTQLRVSGYILLAVLVVPTTFFVVRFGGMPRELPEWRAEMMAKPMPKAFAWTSQPQSVPTIAGYLKPWLATHPLPIEVDGNLVDSPLMLRTRTLESLNLHGSNNTDALLESIQSAQRMLEWSKAARLAVLDGAVRPTEVLLYADPDERAALNTLYNRVLNLHVDAETLAMVTPAIEDALDAMASEDLREESWRMALAMEWRLYQSRRGPPKMFAGTYVDGGNYFPRLERRRADRNVDYAVHSLLSHRVDDGPPSSADFYTFGVPVDIWGTGTDTYYGRYEDRIDFYVGLGPYYKALIEQTLQCRRASDR